MWIVHGTQLATVFMGQKNKATVSKCCRKNAISELLKSIF